MEQAGKNRKEWDVTQTTQKKGDEVGIKPKETKKQKTRNHDLNLQNATHAQKTCIKGR